jgi:hypothetical protein
MRELAAEDRPGLVATRSAASPAAANPKGLRSLQHRSGAGRLRGTGARVLRFVRLSSERARHAVRQDCSFAKKQDSSPGGSRASSAASVLEPPEEVLA